MTVNKEELTTILVTDCGSTTTKALLFEKTPKGWRKSYRGEAPTTVEAPVADVTVGALNAFSEIEELSKRSIVKDSLEKAPFIQPANNSEGIDLYLSTSSAGGGLQMIVAGIVEKMTTESAEKAALGAGAIVMNTISADDSREDHEIIDKIRHLKPDIFLLAGGVDGGAENHVIEMAEILLAAAPKPRFGDTLKLPVIYAGNNSIVGQIKEILGKTSQVAVVDNIRPTIEEENLKPAREAIHEFFLSHVMSHSPGYGKLLSWTPVPIMPTPAAVGDIVYQFAKKNKLQVLCVDIGGATTDVFSVVRDSENEHVFHRTVSANLGMSYSIANVLIEAGVDNIRRWLNYEISNHEIRDRLRNKMIRPTSIPQIREDLWLEQAVCREALRLSFEHHKSLAVGLSGLKKQKGISDIFTQGSSGQELLDVGKLDLVIGSGGVLSHAPDRISAALMMLDAFQLSGITEIAVDSIFMMPHLGVLASVHPEAAEEIFVSDCLVSIAFAIAPTFNKKCKKEKIAEVFINNKPVGTIDRGKVSIIELNEGEVYTLKVLPLDSSVDFGLGRGKEVVREITAGTHGLLLDGRNRPLEFALDRQEQILDQKDIFNRIGLV